MEKVRTAIGDEKPDPADGKLIADEISKRAEAELKPTGTQREGALTMTTMMIPKNTALAARSQVERMTGIEPALSAWESVPFGVV
jgi:hypothetical protein